MNKQILRMQQPAFRSILHLQNCLWLLLLGTTFFVHPLNAQVTARNKSAVTTLNENNRQVILAKAQSLGWNDLLEYVSDGLIVGAMFNHGAIFLENGQAFETYGLIFVKWKALGAYHGIGKPITSELPCPDGVGRFNHFKSKTGAISSIYWTPQTGAHLIYGAIRDKWASLGWERSKLGYPTSDETPANLAGYQRMNTFQCGKIYWASNGRFEVIECVKFDNGIASNPQKN